MGQASVSSFLGNSGQVSAKFGRTRPEFGHASAKSGPDPSKFGNLGPIWLILTKLGHSCADVNPIWTHLDKFWISLDQVCADFVQMWASPGQI